MNIWLCLWFHSESASHVSSLSRFLPFLWIFSQYFVTTQTATNPLDRIRMLSQTGEHGGGDQKVSVVRLYRDIIRNEGVVGLWAGNGANLLRVFPAKAVVFASQDFYRQLIQRYITGGEEKLNAGWSFLSGGMAGMTASLATYPLDLAVRIRQCNRRARGFVK